MRKSNHQTTLRESRGEGEEKIFKVPNDRKAPPAQSGRFAKSHVATRVIGHVSEAQPSTPPWETALPQTGGLPRRCRSLGCILLEFVNTHIAARSVGVGRGWRDVDLTDLDDRRTTILLRLLHLRQRI